MIIMLYVDDITMVASNLATIDRDKQALCRTYEMTNLGELSWILGMHIICNHITGSISLSQEKYSLEILARFNKTDVQPISKPALANECLQKLAEARVNIKAYRSALRALMYPMIGSWPDLAYTVGAFFTRTLVTQFSTLSGWQALQTAREMSEQNTVSATHHHIKRERKE